MLRQGDVLLIPVTQDMTEAKKISDDEKPIVLAEGETSGHAHKIAKAVAVLYALGQAAEAMRILHIQKKTQLVHEEHGALDLDPGLYKVVQQREYTPRAIRNVAD